MKKGSIILALAVLLGSGAVAQAALTVQGNGTVYDSVQDISWDQDGNAVKTLCDANDAIWTSFVPPAPPEGSGRDLAAICAANGRLNWFEAEAWVAHLNGSLYKGIADWRQWTVTQPDPTCSIQVPQWSEGYRCTGSELGHLFNALPPAGLGNPNQLDNNCSACLVNTVPFSNFQSDYTYWSGTEFQPFPGDVWYFLATGGIQSYISKGEQGYVWAVRSGPVAPPAAPTAVPTLSEWAQILLALSLMGMAGWYWQRRAS